MRQPRRPIAAVLSLAIGWTALALGLVAPAHAEGPHDPATYYAGTDGLTGAALEAKLHSIIHDHTKLSYGDLWTALQVTDRDPDNPDDVIDVYSGTSLVASNMCNVGGTCPAMSWNREHSWAKSHGDFGTVTGPGTDLFHMRPELADVNSTRGNLDFDDGGSATITHCSLCTKDTDSFAPRAAIRGDIARGLFYMAVAYDGGDGFPDLQLNDYTCNAGSKAPLHGKLSTLIRWSNEDPPDALEMARNDLIDGTYQHNRNPFIDHPEWVASIWGDGVGQGPTCGTTTGGGGGGGGTGGTPPENIVISEAYVNGGSAGATYKNKYVEIYNPLDSTVDLSPYSLQYRSSGGTGVANGIYNFASTARIASHHYFVVQLPANSTAGGPLPQVDAATTSVNPSGSTGGTLFLAGTHSAVAPDDESVGDLLGYGASNASETTPASTGYSITKSLQRNAANSDTDDNSVDFTNATPTPGTAVDGTGGNPTVAPFTASSNGSPVDVALSGGDVYGDPLTWSAATQPDHGVLSVTGSTATYTPGAGFSGTDVATVTAANNHGGSTSTTLTVTVTNTGGGGNNAPTTSPVSATTDEDNATTVPLSAADADGDTLTWQVTTAPGHGNASVTGSTLTYTPGANFNGDDTVGVTVSDGHGGSATTSVAISVQPVNDAPTATAAEASTAEDAPVTFGIHGSDVDDDPLTYGIKTQPGHGSVTLVDDQVTYTPAADFHGEDTFSWTVSDGSLTSTGTASVTVTPVNDAPTASNLEATTAEGNDVTIPLAGQDVDGDPLSYAVGSAPAHGEVTIVGSDATYVPDAGYSGPDSFTYTASDGTLGSAPATVSVTVSEPGLLTTQLELVTGTATRGSAVTSTVTATGDSGATPSGSVSLLSGDTLLGTGTFSDDGSAVITWTPGSAGSMTLTASYAGDDRFAPSSSAPEPITVRKSASALRITGKHLRAGHAGTIRVRVATVAGVAAGGKVKITLGHKTYKVTVRDGVAVLRVKHLPRGQSVKVKAKYLGDGQYAAGTSSKRLRLKR